ncbi:heat shock protein transcriptional repressor HspR [Actinomyces urinae]|uniref:heat shock protein transcriptional repressor HspR n=1 Tax=Actinomyces urinae TaxID=1689268 RepID=UPI000931A4ED|nr:helix-turn-helix transcriptional regulator [Actinomyces urinae]
MANKRGATYVISVAAELAGMHPQTLRQYDRLGIVTPARTKGRGRRYSASDVERLREVQRLSQDEGVNLEGIRQILELKQRLDETAEAMQLMREELKMLRALVQEESERRSRVFAATPDGSVHTVRRGRRVRVSGNELVRHPQSGALVLFRR